VPWPDGTETNKASIVALRFEIFHEIRKYFNINYHYFIHH